MAYQWIKDRQIKAMLREERAKEAAMWRKARKANPAIARLLWKRVRRSQQNVIEDFFSSGSNDTGLARLVSEG
jgi:hypothetical protein